MSETLKILSIDYDYFIDATEDQIRSCFPDPIDVHPTISTNIWNLHYLTQGDEIKSIGLRSSEYRKLMSKLQSDITAGLCTFSYTHEDILQGIEYLAQYRKFDKVIVNHIDSHPDTGKITCGGLHCGNWVTYLKSMIKEVEVNWISNEIVYEMQIINTKLLSSIKFGIDDLTPILHYDLIFLCRSDQWVPPHLDQQFTDMVYAVRAAGSTGKLDSIKPRKINY